MAKACAAHETAPLGIADSVLRLIGLFWWKTNLRLTNALFTAARKALGAGYYLPDPTLLVAQCCESVASAPLGRVTRFFLSALGDTVQHAGVGSSMELVLNTAIDLMQKSVDGAIPEEHRPHIEAAVVTLAERLIGHGALGALQAAAGRRQGALLLLARVAAQPAGPLMSVVSLQSLLDAVPGYADALMDNAGLFQSVYFGMAATVARLPQSEVETWLLENVLTPHVLAAQLLSSVWVFVVRNSSWQVQAWHMSILLDCMATMAASTQHMICKKRIERLFASVFLHSQLSAQMHVASRADALEYLPSMSHETPGEIAGAAAELLSKSIPSLSSQRSVSKLAALGRLGSACLTNDIAAPFAQSVREVYMRMGSSREAVKSRNQRAAVILLASLAPWFKEGDFPKFLMRVAQARSFLISHLLFLQLTAAIADPSCVVSMASILDQAFQKNTWYHNVGAIQAFQSLSTANIDGESVRELAGRNIGVLSEALQISERTIASDMGTHLAQMMSTAPPNRAVGSVAATLSANVAGSGGQGDKTGAVHFAGLTKSLVSVVMALSSYQGSDWVESERFQHELKQSIAALEKLRK